MVKTESQVSSARSGKLRGGRLPGARFVALVSAAVFLFALTVSLAEANLEMGRTGEAILAYRSLLGELEGDSPERTTEPIVRLRRQIRDLEATATPSSAGTTPPGDRADP